MTFRELMVLLKLYHAAPAELRRWADKQLPELEEAAKLTSPRVEHRIINTIDQPWDRTVVVKCSCGHEFTCDEMAMERDFREHAGESR